jgi:hypothetical protein
MSGALFLLPALRRVHAASPAHPLWSVLGRGDRMAGSSSSPELVPASAFEVVPSAFSAAAVSRLAEVGDAGSHVWLRADPCWLQPDMSSLRMMAWGDMRLTPADAEDLLGVLRPLFGDAGFELSVPHPDRWYLRLAPGSEPPAFSAPMAVLGDDVERHIPAGSSGLHWRRLLNETQMSLHQHRVNVRRAGAGLAPVNSVWFWGGGRLPNRVRATRTHYFSDDLLMRGLAAQANLGCEASPAALDPAADYRDVCVDLRALSASALFADWIEPMLSAGALGTRDCMLAFDCGAVFGLRRVQRWRFWRRPFRLPTATADSSQ